MTGFFGVLGVVLPVGRAAGRSGWLLSPLNPDLVAYRAAAAAGESVPQVMPSAIARGLIAKARRHGLPAPPAPPNVDGLCTFPSSYDRRALGEVTPAWTTGYGCGSCWTYASLASLESCFTPEELWDFSESHMQLKWGDPGAKCDQGGNTEIAAFYLASWRGPVKESDFDPNAPSGQAPPVVKHVQKVLFLPDRTGPLDNCWIKLAVAHIGGVYSGISKSFGFNPDYSTYYNPVAEVIHAVAIIGWDDQFDRNKFFCNDPSLSEEQKIPPADGAWIVKDNGGPTEGEDGFLYVSYYDASIGQMLAVYTGEPPGNYTRNYQYDTLGVTQTLTLSGAQKDFSHQGNVFTAIDDETLAAVGFYEMVDPDMDYEIQVHLDPDNGPVNSSGQHTTTNVSLPLCGYYTVRLPEPVQLAKGQRFGVVLKGRQREGGWPSAIPIEAPQPRFGQAVTAKPGQSFVSVNGASWQDLTTLEVPVSPGVTKILENTNLCIKAFTRSLVYLDARQEAGGQIKWVVTNDASTSIHVRPAARRYRRGRGGAERLDNAFAASYEDARGTQRSADDGWIEVPAHTALTASSDAGAKAEAEWIIFNAYLRTSNEVLIADFSHPTLTLFDQAPAVTSTDPVDGAHINYLGLSVLSVTFDRPIKLGPASSWISVTSSNETKLTMPIVNGAELKIVLATPLTSQQLGGTSWTVNIPATAVLGMLEQPMAHNYSWTFTVTGVN